MQGLGLGLEQRPKHADGFECRLRHIGVLRGDTLEFKLDLRQGRKLAFNYLLTSLCILEALNFEAPTR